MDWLFIVLVAVFALLVLLIVVFLITLFKQGDERYEHIKSKAIANSFMATIGLLITDLCYAIYQGGIQTTNEAKESISMLITIAIIFLASLLWGKRKYGG